MLNSDPVSAAFWKPCVILWYAWQVALAQLRAVKLGQREEALKNKPQREYTPQMTPGVVRS